MQTDLSIRLRAYAETAEVEVPANPLVYAEALACSRAAAAAASAGIICSHTRILRGDSPPDYLRPGQDELEFLVADKPLRHEDPATDQPDAPDATGRTRLPLLPDKDGDDGLNKLALGAEGVLALKSRTS